MVREEGEGRMAGWGVHAWRAAGAAKASFRAPWSSFCRRESMYLCVPLGGEKKGVCVCVCAHTEGRWGWLGKALRMHQTSHVWMCSFECVSVHAVRSRVSSSSPLIILNCVCWDLPPSQRSSRKSGLLPKSAESYPDSSDWPEEEQQETSKGPAIKIR